MNKFLCLSFCILEAQIAELQKKLGDAFDLFDEEGNKQVDVREIGTIFRSLGLCPSESELQDLISQVIII